MCGIAGIMTADGMAPDLTMLDALQDALASVWFIPAWPLLIWRPAINPFWVPMVPS